jgi:hypothetical protein
MKRSRLECRRAALRLSGEELVRVDVLAREIFFTKETVRRWGYRGRLGIHRDILLRAGVEYTSRAALVRFLDAGKKLDATIEATAAQFVSGGS